MAIPDWFLNLRFAVFDPAENNMFHLCNVYILWASHLLLSGCCAVHIGERLSTLSFGMFGNGAAAIDQLKHLYTSGKTEYYIQQLP